MLSNISWQGYWTFLVLTTVLYYTFVFLFFFRKPLIHRVRNLFSATAVSTIDSTVKRHPSLYADKASSFKSDEDGPEHLPAVRSLVDEVHAYFESKNSESNTKTVLLADLKTIIHKHPDVKGTPYQHALNNLILFLAEQNGSIHLSAEEVGSMWLYGEGATSPGPASEGGAIYGRN